MADTLEDIDSIIPPEIPIEKWPGTIEPITRKLIIDADARYRQLHGVFAADGNHIGPGGIIDLKELRNMVDYMRSVTQGASNNASAKGDTATAARFQYFHDLMDPNLRYLSGILDIVKAGSAGQLAEKHAEDSEVNTAVNVALRYSAQAVLSEVALLATKIDSAKHKLLSLGNSMREAVRSYVSHMSKPGIATADSVAANLELIKALDPRESALITETIYAVVEQAENIDDWTRKVGSLGQRPSPSDIKSQDQHRIDVLRSRLENLDEAVPADQLLSAVAENFDCIVFGYDHDEESGDPAAFFDRYFPLLKQHGFRWLALELPRAAQPDLETFFKSVGSPQDKAALLSALRDNGVINLSRDVKDPDSTAKNMVQFLDAARRNGLYPVAVDSPVGSLRLRLQADDPYVASNIHALRDTPQPAVGQKGKIAVVIGALHDGGIQQLAGQNAIAISLQDRPEHGLVFPGIEVPPDEGRVPPQHVPGQPDLVINPAEK